MQITKMVGQIWRDGHVCWHTIPDYSIYVGDKVVKRLGIWEAAYDYAVSLNVVCFILNEKTQSRTVINPFHVQLGCKR